MDPGPDVGPASQAWEQEGEAPALSFWGRLGDVLLAERVAGLTFENWPMTRNCWRGSHPILTRRSAKPSNGISKVPPINLLPSDPDT